MRFTLGALLSAVAVAAPCASAMDSPSSNLPPPPGCCSISVQALMFSGGSSSETLNLDKTQDGGDDDDDDDDDDDGHSSMLSNASVSASSFYQDDGIVHHRPVSRSRKALSARGGAAIRAGQQVQPPPPAPAAQSSELPKKLLVSAIVTLVFEGCIGHVLEFFKIVMQTSPAGTTYASVFRDITDKKGLSGLWDGFAPWGVIQAVLKGGVFGLAHAAALNILLPMAHNEVLPMALALTMAGGIGGGFQGYVLSPTLLLKTRVMTNPVFRESMSLWKTTMMSLKIGADVVQKEGLLTLFKGANVFATKRVFDWSTRYYFSDLFESIFQKIKTNRQGGGEPAELTGTERSIASFLGGVASTILTLPLDVLVAKTQDAKKAGVAVSALAMFREELKTKGVAGLRDAYLRGFEARLLHVCLTTVVMKTGAPIVYDLLFGK